MSYLVRSMMKRMVLVSAVLLGCGSPGPTSPPPVPPPTPRAAAAGNDVLVTSKFLDGDTKVTTTAGATFEAPKGWTLKKAPDVITIVAPEGDVRITFYDAREKDAAKAVALAWKRVDPKLALKVKTTNKPPPRDGWEEVTHFVYDTPAAESREVIAYARRKGDFTYVGLLEGSVAGVDRRGAQIATALGSFRASGVEEESFAGRKANALDEARLEAFAAFVEEARVKGKVPGVGLAIVQGNVIVLERGLGARAFGKEEPVGPNTLFMIGSITKSLTSLMMAKLVDEGRFGWDTPVTSVLPTFALGDPAATNRLAMRHTVCACTGLPRQDMTFFFGFGKATPESRIEEMKSLAPTTALGETFQYSNLMVTAGGYVAAHAADGKKALGPAYDATMQSRVLDPIGMKASTFDFAVAQKREHARPHSMTSVLDVRALPESAEAWIPSIRPAGGLWSSAHDMARWVAVELGDGKTIEGRRVVSAESLRERYKPMVRASEHQSYGLAVMVEKYAGVDVVWHNGGTLGFNTLSMWLPDHQVGLVVLTNLNGAGAFLNAVRRRFFEAVFDAKDEAASGFDFALERKKKVFAAEFGDLESPPDASFVARVAGTWENAQLGKVTLKGDTFETAEWKSKFARKKEGDGGNKILLVDPPWVGFDFVVAKDGTLVLDIGQEKYVFKR